METRFKDPQAVMDYKIKWYRWLGTDTILSSSWSADSPNITIDDGTQHNDTEAVVWLSGGVAGETYILTNHIVTAGGREEDGSIRIVMVHK